MTSILPLSRLIVLLASLSLALTVFDPRLEIWGDNAEFIILGQSLATHQGYRMLNEPNPTINARLPPGLPAELAPLIALAGPNLTILKSLILIQYVLAITLFFELLFTWLCGPPWQLSPEHAALLAALTALLTAANWLIVDFSSQVMSEIPYLALTLLCLWCNERSRSPKAPARWAAIASVSALAAYFVRTAGIALLIALTLDWAYRRRYRWTLLHVLLAAAFVIPWALWIKSHAGVSYITQLILLDPYRPYLGTITVSDFLSRLHANAWLYAGVNWPLVIWPTANATTGWFIAAGEGIATLLLLVNLRRSRRIDLPLYIIMYGAILCVWPSSWCVPRMLIPLIPFVVAAIVFVGVSLCAIVFRNRSSPSLHPALLTILLLALFLPYLPWQIGSVATFAYGRPTGEFADLYQLCAWIPEHIPRSAVICARKPHLVYLLAHRRAVGESDRDPARFLEILTREGVDYVLESHLKLPWEEHYPRLISAYPDRFALIHSVGSQRLFARRH